MGILGWAFSYILIGSILREAAHFHIKRNKGKAKDWRRLIVYDKMQFVTFLWPIMLLVDLIRRLPFKVVKR